VPFCPKCKYEYNPEVSKCPDCGEWLVSTLPAEEKDTPLEEQYKDWVQLARLTSYDQAEMIVEAWRSKDIPGVVLSGSGHFGITGQMGSFSYRPIGGGYSLLVPKQFVSDADIEAEIILGKAWAEARLIDIDRY
jgi:hypothetical protein